jgi:glycosyltransferase involved in cell wall biosynthesis
VVPVWTDFFLTNKLVEYLTLGLPAIVTESAALRLYLDDRDVCFVPPKDPHALADAILALYENPQLRAALGAAGHAAYLQHFAWERARHDYLAIYGARVDSAPYPGVR